MWYPCRLNGSLNRCVTAALVALLAASSGCSSDKQPAAGQPPVRILSPAVTGNGTVAVVGFSFEAVAALDRANASLDEWRGIFGVFVVTEDTPGLPSMLGAYHTVGDTLIFSPRFSFLPEQLYRVVVSCQGVTRLSGIHVCNDTAADKVTDEFTPPSAEMTPTMVDRVFPSSDEVPENLLKFYVYFSQPMRGGDVYQHVRLIDEDGNAVEQGFVETVAELWDPKQRRLTLICHPGRIKRGLALNERLGPPLTAGRRYRLVVDVALRDAYGNPLADSFEKTFTVIEADRQSPVVGSWEIDSPRAGTLDPVRVTFDGPMDHALLQRLVTIVTEEDDQVVGRLEVIDGEVGMLYHPDKPWTPGPYKVAVHSTLEDLAGNRLDGVFDRSMDGKLPSDRGGEALTDRSSIIHVPFSVRVE